MWEDVRLMANYKRFVLAIAVFAMVPGLSITGIAFAYQDNVDYTHTPATDLTNPGLVCGDHKCASGEVPHYPTPVAPVREH